jgi:Mn-dependent DtxR family transcriptional regulator
MKDKDLDLYESVLLSLYIKRYEQYGDVLTSDSKAAEYLKIDRKYVGKKRRHLEELGYIKYNSRRGCPMQIVLNKDKICCID